MRITFLGTGTSHGIPVIGCGCAVCKSGNPKNKRTRASVLLETEDSFILIDTATEFRLQAVREGVKRIDCVLFTHSHADHIHGLDDLRPLSKENPIPAFGNGPTINDLRKRFSYVSEAPITGGGRPRVKFIRLDEKREVDLKTMAAVKKGAGTGLSALPVPVKHGSLDIYGYRIGSMAYLTDCSHIPEKSMKLLDNLDTLIIGALRHRPHPTHFSVKESLAVIKELSCRRAYLTHMCHDIEHEELKQILPENVFPSYDSLKIETDNF